VVLDLPQVVRHPRAPRRRPIFERDFWSGGDLVALYQSARNHRHNAGSLERIFEAGFGEFNKLRGKEHSTTARSMDGARRAMRATYQRELDDLEAHLAFLASVGSVSPPTSACSARCGAS
jgi:biopolymer transport protein TolQ